MTRTRFAERLGEMKREDWPRFSVAHVLSAESRPGRALLAAAADPAVREIIDAYLRHYVPGDCPCCGYGVFGWGIQHGAGSCWCGWPGRYFHHITDDREEEIVSLEALLWSHPYEVTLRP